MLPSIGRKAKIHLAFTVEGRDDSELPEQTLCAVRCEGLDLFTLAKDADAM